MSLFDSASLVVTPNGYKEDKLYSIKPTDGSGDLVVTRATTATRVNSDGLIEQVPYNFAQYSEQFNNGAWAKSDIIISANAIIAPNGSTTADKIIANTNNAAHAIYQAIPRGTYSFSIYAKAGEETLFSMWLSDFSKRAVFDLSNGTIIGSNVTNSTITDEGNGWYRCSVYDNSLTEYIALYGKNGTSYVGNGVDGFYLWGAQVTQGTLAKEYFPTTDRLDVPRLDYTNSSCPSILVEPQRTNLFIYSNDFVSYWVDDGTTTKTANSGISPDGTQNATKIVGTGYGYRFAPILGVGNCTFSIYFKASANSSIDISVNDYGGSGLTNKSISVTTNWQRFDITKNITLGTTVILSFSGLDAGIDYYVYGAQLEAGSYATSYIPTIASSVTRNADVISKTGISSLIGQTEGTLFFDGTVNNAINPTTNIINTNKNAPSISTFTLQRAYAGNKYEFYIFKGNGGFDNIGLSSTNNYALGQRVKIAVRYKSGDMAMYINGILEDTSSDTYTNNGTKSELFLNDAVTYFAYQEIVSFNSVVLFTSGLTNDELAQLTTI